LREKKKKASANCKRKKVHKKFSVRTLDSSDPILH